MTPDQLALAQRSKLDAVCLRCGHTSAATARCYQECWRWMPSGPDDGLIYISHAEQKDWPGSYLCGGAQELPGWAASCR